MEQQSRYQVEHLRDDGDLVWDLDLRSNPIENARVYSVNLWEPMGYQADGQASKCH